MNLLRDSTKKYFELFNVNDVKNRIGIEQTKATNYNK